MILLKVPTGSPFREGSGDENALLGWVGWDKMIVPIVHCMCSSRKAEKGNSNIPDILVGTWGPTPVNHFGSFVQCV